MKSGYEEFVPLNISRSPCGERGLKYVFIFATFNTFKRRSPCGERGLKSNLRNLKVKTYVSLPVRGAWIEMATCTTVLL